MFWRHLVRLSREEQVTIFVSTHFMNEAERCDRISLMHRGRVLAVGTPAELTAQQGRESWRTPSSPFWNRTATSPRRGAELGRTGGDDLLRLCRAGFVWAFARREATELLRDRLRLAFALAGPIVLLMIVAYSVSFDVQNIRMAVLDHDHSAASRETLRAFEGGRYFIESPAMTSEESARKGLQDGSIELLIDIPPGFGRDLAAGRRPEVGLIIDGASPFTGSSIRAYADGVFLTAMMDQLRNSPLPGAGN
jgi:ribosome-dependent ATPase